jgi:hypothetical protein
MLVYLTSFILRRVCSAIACLELAGLSPAP